MEVDIEIPREKAVALFLDPENLKHWQRGFQSFRQISGEPGREGSQTELQYLMGKRPLLMIGTLIKNNPPEEVFMNYDAKGVQNIQRNYFRDLDGASCRWISETEFQFSALSMKLMAWLLPGMFKKQSLTYMQDFKQFAEKGISVCTL